MNIKFTKNLVSNATKHKLTRVEVDRLYDICTTTGKFPITCTVILPPSEQIMSDIVIKSFGIDNDGDLVGHADDVSDDLSSLLFVLSFGRSDTTGDNESVGLLGINALK